ncbi:helitron helicase-like domain-containing protein [Artemisia annua]|uniref:Helitron helicase-like domain-containing protein n=1 Tax=Artemisia annua TaxID=35608 RepID=A0A2U1KY09_ARTAN|nr:helitron helicase-like domain-containing protein [Artemisia annua]
MTSFGTTIENFINKGRGPYVFRVSGQIYHSIGGLCPMGNDTPRFLQLYIYDTANEDADIPNFSVRLFGVTGANQYELPTADTIGAIVYEGCPQTVTDYDVVIERYSRDPERINKLHPCYMALQFPLLFIYGEEGYHLKLKLINAPGMDSAKPKKMSMKVYYAYQIFDRLDRLSFAALQL